MSSKATQGLFSAISGGKVEDGVIRGVSVITIGEAKGHGTFIDQKSLETFLSVASARGSVPVKMDHGTGFAEIVGKLENFRIEGDSLRADLVLLKSHEAFERIVEMARTMPENFGLSVSGTVTNEKVNGQKCIRCHELGSVDLVDRPAANPNGLFDVPVDSSESGMAEANALLAKIKSVFVDTENADLAAANKQVTDLTAKVGTLETQLGAKDKSIADKDTEIANLKAAQSDFDAKVAKAASAKALEIAASMGIKPAPINPDATPGTAGKRDFKSEVKPLSGVERLALERK